jgi:hypothetical protein
MPGHWRDAGSAQDGGCSDDTQTEEETDDTVPTDSLRAQHKRARSIAGLLTSPLRPAPVTSGAAVALNRGATALYVHQDSLIQFYVRLARLLGASSLAQVNSDLMKDVAEKVTEVRLSPTHMSA